MTRYTNANIFINGHFEKGSFDVENGRFHQVCTDSGLSDTGSVLSPDITAGSADDIVDLEDALVIPGLIDIHGHGNSGFDFSTCDYHGLETMAKYLARSGITAFAPTSMTMPYDALASAYANAAALHARQKDSPGNMARVAGINMEGPYFSYGKRGAQNPAFLKTPDVDAFLKLQKGCGGLIRLVDIAPELDGAMEFIRQISPLCTVSVAHTEADYETVCEAFQNGATHMTHLFNGMNGIHHRNPGPVCAAFDTPGIFVELICDGIHIHPSVIRMVFRLLSGRVILISDALACCGMGDGQYSLGDQEVWVKNRRATLKDGTLAGSASNVFDMLRNVISFGIPMEEAILSATLHPARQLGIDHELGSIAEDKKADFLVCTESLQLKSVFINGCKVQN